MRGAAVLTGALLAGLALAGSRPATPAEGRADRRCGIVAGARWTVDATAGNTWVVYTDRATCEAALDLVPRLTARTVVDIADIAGFRCTANAMRGGAVLSGICYGEAPDAGHFAWGATAAGYDHPAACAVCTGVPGEPHAAPRGADAGPSR